MADDKIRMLYIAGWGRSGSTILSNILGQIEGFFSAGELRYLGEHYLLSNWPCGCGQPFQQCELWSEVIKQAFGGFDQIDGDKVISMSDKIARTRHLANFISSKKSRHLSEDQKQYSQFLDHLYKTIHSVTGSKIIVDSSKFPSYAFFLSLLPGIDLSIIHLVRDSRAVGYSWQKKTSYPQNLNNVYMPQISYLRSALIWDVWNIAIERFKSKSYRKYIFLRYEDFMLNPQKSLTAILDMVNLPNAKLPLQGDHSILIEENHTLSGNPVAFKQGLIELKIDDEWRKRSFPANKMLTTILTFPLLYKYGYHGFSEV